MTPTTRIVGEGLPYIRVALPSGRTTVLRTYRASFALRRYGVAVALSERAQDAFKHAETLDGAAKMEARADAFEASEAVTGYMVGSVWSDPAWSLDAWDDNPDVKAGNTVAIGAAVIAELDEAGWSVEDIGALGRAARTILTASEAPDIVARVQAAIVGEELAPDKSGIRVAEEVNEQADFCDAPRA